MCATTVLARRPMLWIVRSTLCRRLPVFLRRNMRRNIVFCGEQPHALALELPATGFSAAISKGMQQSDALQIKAGAGCRDVNRSRSISK